jgi:hypothetical protein
MYWTWEAEEVNIPPSSHIGGAIPSSWTGRWKIFVSAKNFFKQWGSLESFVKPT